MLRTLLFWFHLVCGLAAGVLILIMSFTGAALTFEKDLIAWAERDSRRVAPPSGEAPRLTLDAIVEKVRSLHPDARILNATVALDRAEAVALGLPNNRTLCVNPYTGEVKEATAPRMRAFMQTMRSWHTRLNVAPLPAPAPGQPRPTNPGAAANAAANVIFVGLGLSGLVLWWPRAWHWRALRPSLAVVWDARGKARDWNWHNAIGFWSLPLLLLLAGTGVVLSYRWAGDLVYKIAGETPPAPMGAPSSGARPGGNTPAASSVPATPAAKALTPTELLAAAQKPFADWTLITLRFNPALGGTANSTPPATVAAAVKTADQWPPFFTRTLHLDAVTGAVKREEKFGDLSPGTQARRWIRLLHSAEALGWFVQLLSGLACLGGCILVYTGFALAWRRFFPSSSAAATAPPPTQA